MTTELLSFARNGQLETSRCSLDGVQDAPDFHRIAGSFIRASSPTVRWVSGLTKTCNIPGRGAMTVVFPLPLKLRYVKPL